ncbi:MAG: ParA family protein [Cyanobacteria bacterium SBLK]|nr:ParA family protein [Cyanobacteria bacterium SBLK]
METQWPKRELYQKLTNVYEQKSEEWVDFNISTSGLLNLTIVSDRFRGFSMSERREEIQTILQEFTPSLGFISLYTVEEANSLNLSRPQLTDEKTIQTWQDLALWATNPQNQSPSEQNEQHFPKTVTFYSYKGGVGRTTALIHVAWILAKRGRKVVIVDLDLEAPGLTTAFQLDRQPPYGIIDYFYERAYLPEGIEPDILVTKIFSEVRVPDATGRLFVVPAGILSFDYISKVDDLRATSFTNNGDDLWSVFRQDIQNQIKPDIILVDSRTGINKWGAFSLLQAANEAIVFLFPNDQNAKGIELLVKSLQSFGKISINFVFSPVPDPSDLGMAKVKEMWKLLSKQLEDRLTQNNIEGEDLEPLVIPYLLPVALAENYPIENFVNYYNQIANLIDIDTQINDIQSTLQNSNNRWEIIESLNFQSLNASEQRQEGNAFLFQPTADFNKFLDETTCLIKGRKGTGKTELYLLFLKHEDIVRNLEPERLKNVIFLSGHGSVQDNRPSRNEFEILDRELKDKNSSWETLWRAYLLLRICHSGSLDFLANLSKKTKKFEQLRNILQNLSEQHWQSEHTQALIQLATDLELRLILPDALDFLDEQQQDCNQILWFLYDDLDEDLPTSKELQQRAITGLFQLIQACDARHLQSIRFKIFLREDIWDKLIFENKSHFNGRDIYLQWTRLDFLRLALRQATQSSKFKDLLDLLSPVENIDRVNEDPVEQALKLLWGIHLEGKKSKYVSRWVYERLTDSSGTTFPRSLSVLLQGAKQHELTYKDQTSVQAPRDRLLRKRSLEVGLEKASEERCDAIKQEYPELSQFFDALEGVTALPTKEELKQIWQKNAGEIRSTFNEFSELLSDIGLAQWREKAQCYGFADIYVYGFKMTRTGTKS